MAGGEEKIAKRYARAYFEAAAPADLGGLREGLEELGAAWRGSADLRAALENPAVPLSERIAVARDIAGKIRPGDASFGNFLEIIVENKRLETLPAVSRAFGHMLDELRKLLALEVTSAFELGADEKQSFAKQIESKFGSLASITWRVDPQLLGGLQVKAGDRLLDNSIHGALEKMRASLLS